MNIASHYHHMHGAFPVAGAPSLKTLREQAFKRRLEGRMDDVTVPLCVDLDGTIMCGTVFHELMLVLLRNRPLAIIRIVFLALLSPARLRRYLSQAATLDPATLPFRKDVLTFLAGLRAHGHNLILVSSANRRTAQAVAQHLGLFSETIATGDDRHLSPSSIARLLCARFGPGQFDFAGHHFANLALWHSARRAILVAPSTRLLRHSTWNRQEALTLAPTRKIAGRYLEAVHPARWGRNLLVFLPLLANVDSANLQEAITSYLAFCVFCLIGSASYIVNDLADLASDRHHPVKRRRALASGRLPPTHGLFLAATLAIPGIAIALIVSSDFAFAILCYAALTLSYSFWLKQIAGLDIFALAALYLSRILAGGIAIAMAPSFWAISFTVPLFLGLAALNRYAELESGQRPTLRQPRVIDDLPMLASFGIASGYMAALVLALYARSPEAARTYRSPEILWLLCPLILYVVTRAWSLACRSEMNEDPVLFALRSSAVRRAATAILGLLVLASRLPSL